MATFEQQLFLDELSKQTRNVLSSRHGLWIENLSRWFDIIDSDLAAHKAVKALESSVDFDTWHNVLRAAIETKKSSHIRFPRDRSQSLGIRLRMFRAIVEDEFELFSFSLHFLGVHSEQDIVTAMSQDIFLPMVEDLNKYLTEYFEAPDKLIPAADRIVRLDHNSADYKDIINAAEEFRRELIKTNVVLEDKDRVVAEVSAGIELLKAPSVNTDALKATLVKGAKYVADKAGEAIIGATAVGLLGLIAHFFGII